MEYSDEFKELTNGKLFSLIKLDKDNISNLEDIVTPKELIYKNNFIGYRYICSLNIKGFVGRCCFHSYDEIVELNGWILRNPDMEMTGNIKNKVMFDLLPNNTYYFLFISENESDHVKLKLMM